MIDQKRWRAEQAKMAKALPQVRPFVDVQQRLIGFSCRLKLADGRTHRVKIVASTDSYPATPPSIFIEPFVGDHRLADGSLCLHRQWQPAQDTFAQQLLFVIKYLTEH